MDVMVHDDMEKRRYRTPDDNDEDGWHGPAKLRAVHVGGGVSVSAAQGQGTTRAFGTSNSTQSMDMVLYR